MAAKEIAFDESARNKILAGVNALAVLCLAGEEQTGDRPRRRREASHAELQSRTHPNHAGSPR